MIPEIVVAILTPAVRAAYNHLAARAKAKGFGWWPVVLVMRDGTEQSGILHTNQMKTRWAHQMPEGQTCYLDKWIELDKLLKFETQDGKVQNIPEEWVRDVHSYENWAAHKENQPEPCSNTAMRKQT